MSSAIENPDEVRGDVSGGEVYTTSVRLELPYSGFARHIAVVIGTGASANLDGAKWLNNHNAIPKALGRPLAKIAPAFASFRYGDGRVGDVRRAAIIPNGIVGADADIADADIPALLDKEALETLGGRLNFCQRVRTLEALGADIPLEMSAAGHYLLNAADFPESNSAGTSGRRTNCCAKRVVNDNGMARNDALFFMGVTPTTKMRPAGKGGPSLILSCLETKLLEPGRLRPKGKILPSLRLDGTKSGPTSEVSVDPPPKCPFGCACGAPKCSPFPQCSYVDGIGRCAGWGEE